MYYLITRIHALATKWVFFSSVAALCLIFQYLLLSIIPEITLKNIFLILFLNIPMTIIGACAIAKKHIERYAKLASHSHIQNREVFCHRLKQILENPENNSLTVIAVVDVDHLRTINDLFGREVGDLVLIEIETKLQKLSRCHELCAKIDSDEFVIAVVNFRQDTDIANFLQKLQTTLSGVYTINDNAVQVTVSIGVAIHPIDSETPEQLVKDAELAVATAKASGRGICLQFSNALREMAAGSYSLETELREAIETGAFREVYQPKVSENNELIGAEALSRWKHPKRDTIYPDMFIQAAEKYRCIYELDLYMLHKVCRQIASWIDRGFDIKPISVNISTQSLQMPSFADAAFDVINNSGCPYELLVLEITESEAIVNSELVQLTLDAFIFNGLKLSLDDFGTGFSTLTTIKDIPFSEVKIDKKFISDILTNTRNQTIVEMTYVLASSLGLSLVVEGVETDEQFEYLKRYSDLVYQGFLFSKPLECSEFEALMHYEYVTTVQA